MSNDTEPIRVSWREARVEESGDGNRIETVDTAERDTFFESRVRLLLGAPASAKVAAQRVTTDVNPWGCDTWESDEEVTILAGGKSRTFDSTARLIGRLEAMDLVSDGQHVVEYDDKTLKNGFLGLPATFILRDGRVWVGRLGNASGHRVLLIGDTFVPGCGRTRVEGEAWSDVCIGHIDRVVLND
jgi:hypothetical protein